MARIISSHMFHNKSINVGDGIEYSPIKGSSEMILSISISGTATARTVVFEAKGSIGGYVPIICSNISNTVFSSTSSGTSDEIWQVDLAGIKSFRARISSISGGYLSISGEIVDEN